MERVIAAISKCQDKKGMQQLLTMPTEVIAVTVLMMVGMGLNLPAWKTNASNDSHHVKLKINWSDDDGVSTYMSVNYDIQTDAIGLDKCPSLYPILVVIFGKPGQKSKG